MMEIPSTDYLGEKAAPLGENAASGWVKFRRRVRPGEGIVAKRITHNMGEGGLQG
jgi:hypothetical protein